MFSRKPLEISRSRDKNNPKKHTLCLKCGWLCTNIKLESFCCNCYWKEVNISTSYIGKYCDLCKNRDTKA